MDWDLFRGPWGVEQASSLATLCWFVLAVVWLLMRIGIKRAKRRESAWQFAEHALPALLGFWLIFEKGWKWGPFEYRPLPEIPAVWNTGLALVLVGTFVGLWARFSLGRNWSGAVTLKTDHELVGSGPYRWIRHPIYTGLLSAALGTAMIKGHLRGWIGFAILALMFYYKARREERFLGQEFGAGFTEHLQRTGMFLPKFS